MKSLLVTVLIVVLLVIWRLVGDREKEDERRELVKAIRGELREMRDDIIKEIRGK
jgi:hypothetical protein